MHNAIRTAKDVIFKYRAEKKVSLWPKVKFQETTPLVDGSLVKLNLEYLKEIFTLVTTDHL